MNLKILAFFGLLFTCTLQAQSQKNKILSGYIRDQRNAESIIGASISIAHTAYSTITNGYGFYSISLPTGEYEINCSSVGFETQVQHVLLTEDRIVDLNLSRASKELLEVKVHASDATKRIRNTEVSVNKLEVATLRKLPVVFGEVDILKSIQLLPGVTTTSDASIGFNVRGGGVDQNLILLDEAIVYNPAHAFGLFSIFNGDAIKDLKLYKGGIPVEYGGRLSSVLDVKQYEGNAKKYELKGGIGLISSRLALEGPLYKKKGDSIANNSFFIAGRRTYADLFLAFSSDSTINKNRLYFYDLNMKTNWKLNAANQLFLSGYFGRDIVSFNDFFVNSYGNTTLTFRWNHEYNKKLFSNLAFVYSDYQYLLEIKLNTPFQWTANIVNYNLKGNWEYAYTPKMKLNFGFFSNAYSINPGRFEPTSGTSSFLTTQLDKKYGLENSVFVGAEQSIGSHLKLSYGLRLNYYFNLGKDTVWQYQNNLPVLYNAYTRQYEKGLKSNQYSAYGEGQIISSDFSIDPRLNINYIINNEQSIKASYNRMHQFVQLVSNSSSPTPTNVYTLANSFIPVQYADQFTIGYFHNLTLGNDWLIELSAETFYKKYYNLIDYIDGAELLFNNNLENAMLKTDGKAYGIELMVAKNEGNLTGWLSYTYSDSKRQSANGVVGPGLNEGKEYMAPYNIPHSFNATATYQFSPRVSASFVFIYKSGVPYTYPVSSYVQNGLIIPHYEQRNASRLSDYHRLDLSCTLEGRKHPWYHSRWVFSIFNVYNHFNTASIFYQERSDKLTGAKTQQAVALAYYGLVPSVSYEFNF